MDWLTPVLARDQGSTDRRALEHLGTAATWEARDSK
jgi:hypothetical protein